MGCIPSAELKKPLHGGGRGGKTWMWRRRWPGRSGKKWSDRETKVRTWPQTGQLAWGIAKPTELRESGKGWGHEGSWDQAQPCALVRSRFLCQLNWQATGMIQAWKQYPLTTTIKGNCDCHLEPFIQVSKSEHMFPSHRGEEAWGTRLERESHRCQSYRNTPEDEVQSCYFLVKGTKHLPYIKLRQQRNADCFSSAGAE